MKNNNYKKSGAGRGAKSGAGKSGKGGKSGKSGGEIIGKIDGNSRGFAFLLSEKGDLYIPKDSLKGARHGDTVRAAKTGGDKAAVKEILARGATSLVGTYFESGQRGYVVPDDTHFSAVLIRRAECKAGEKVVVALEDNGEGIVIETLGRAGEDGVDLKSIIRAFGLSEKFPKSVLKDADRLKNADEPDIIGREDFRKDIVFTIDGEDSRDFDDAVSIKRVAAKSRVGDKRGADGDGKGGYILTVHIADVAHYVAPDSPLDKEAYSRATSVYFPFAVLPMLPERLSEDLCCLKEGEDRLTLSVTMHINCLGAVTAHKVTEGVINCVKRLTYNQAAEILKADAAGAVSKEYKQVAKPLKHMHDLCLLLLARRRERGAIDFESDEPQITMTDGRVTDVKKAERLTTHKMIEEFMILANQTVAKHFFEEKTPFIYRGHPAPPPEKLERLRAFLDTLGVAFDYGSPFDSSRGSLNSLFGGGEGFSVPAGQPCPKDFARLLESAPPDLKSVISAIALRSMTKAIYEPASNGHYGLALMRYCHFTAPIRRYPDLFIHRVIKARLKGEGLKKYAGQAADAAKQSSLKERLAEDASRRVNDLLVAKYMAQFVGEVFEGVVSGVTSWGVFVRLSNTAEGLIRIEKLDGAYLFDERSISLRGAKTYRMGQRVKIKVFGVSGDRIEFLPESDGKTDAPIL